MSPEQARGKPVDKRTDIWAFGCVVYELLTGRRAFEGETVTDVLSAIVRAEPDWTRLPDETPPAVRTLLDRVLTKDAQLRLRDIGDVPALLDAAVGRPRLSVHRLAEPGTDTAGVGGRDLASCAGHGGRSRDGFRADQRRRTDVAPGDLTCPTTSA